MDNFLLGKSIERIIFKDSYVRVEIISRRRYGIKIRKGSLSYLQVAVLIVKRRRREGSLQPSIPVENERDCRQKHHDHSG